MNLQNNFKQVREASRELALLEQAKIDAILLAVADLAVERSGEIIEANHADLKQMDEANPMYDRLLLTRDRVEAIAADIRNVAKLDSPVGEVLSRVARPNGVEIKKVRVPFGVVGVIYEARPNVSFDLFSLCLKSKNAVILKGGSDAHHSNSAIVALVHDVLEREGVNKNMVMLMPPEREYTAELLNAVDFVDVLIPRGSASLINYVRDNARVPVIETGTGVCHTYFHGEGDLKKGSDIVFNAKTRRVSVCNALECLLIDAARLGDLPALCAPLAEKNVTVYADERSYNALQGAYPTELLDHVDPERHYGIEFLDYKMAVRTVDSLDDAVAHIEQYSSQHSDAIVTDNSVAAELFVAKVDSACVYVNVSTAFTDGAQFGFGAEVGISTQKLHARGPMALAELTSYKYIVSGNGQTRS